MYWYIYVVCTYDLSLPRRADTGRGRAALAAATGLGLPFLGVPTHGHILSFLVLIPNQPQGSELLCSCRGWTAAAQELGSAYTGA